jgi:hypothetical protein
MVQNIPFAITGGVNDVDSEELLDGEVRTSRNFLFESGESKTRPGLREEDASASATQVFYGKSERMWDGQAPLTVLLRANTGISRLENNNTVTNLSGAALSLENGGYARVAAVNGVILIASNTGGMIRWDPTGSTYTILDQYSKYRYLTSHLTRVIGAYYLDTSFTGYSRRVGWSHQGDETEWEPAADNSANFTLLNDIPDDITGIGVIKNVVVVYRRSGFHFAYPTGIANPTYRFEAYTRDGVGLYYPHTLAVEDNLSAFVGPDDVYIFDLRVLEPVGHKIRNTLFSHLLSGVTYAGFFSRYNYGVGGKEFRTRYNLFPMITPGNTTAIDTSEHPHFVYDLAERKWSIHTYGTATCAFNRVRTPVIENLVLYDGSGNLHSWDPTVACEQPATLRTGNALLGSLDEDIRLQRVLVRHRDLGTGVCRLTGYCSYERGENSSSNDFNVGGAAASGKWIRAWCTLDEDFVGQDFHFDLTVPAGVKFSTNRWLLRCSPNGQFRGDEYAF